MEGEKEIAKIVGVGELEIQFAVLELMKDGKIWSNADLKQRLRSQLAWSDHDKERSPTRNEFRWENRVNNALSPSRKSSLYGRGHVVNAGHGLHQITENGKRVINDDFDPNDLVESLQLPIPRRPFHWHLNPAPNRGILGTQKVLETQY